MTRPSPPRRPTSPLRDPGGACVASPSPPGPPPPSPVTTSTDRAPARPRLASAPTVRGGLRGLVAAVLLCLPLASARATGAPDLLTPVRSGHRAPDDVAVVIRQQHHDRLPNVPHAARDADAITTTLIHTLGVPVGRIHPVLDGSPRRIRAALAKAADQVGPEGTLWVFYVGHGLVSPLDGRYLLLPADADRPGVADDDWVDLAEVADTTADSEAARVMVVVDASFSGLDRRGERLFDDLSLQVEARPGRVHDRVSLWLATTTHPVAGRHDTAQHGLFTWLVLGALRGWADGTLGAPDGVVRLQEAQRWVRQALSTFGRSEDPTLETRARPLAWALSQGRLQTAPDLTEIPQPGPDVPLSGSAVAAAAEAREAARARDRMEAEVREQVQAAADRDWSELLTRVHRRSPDAPYLLRRFLDRYSARTYPLGHGDVVVTAKQVPEARALLQGGGRLHPDEPLIPTVRVPTGTFTMGTPAGTPGADPDRPLHDVTLTRTLAVGTTEVTVEQWVDVMGFRPPAADDDDDPVTGVSWAEAIAFCNALSDVDGLPHAYTVKGARVEVDLSAPGWRLPTEAEWEFLASAGESPWAGFSATDRACRHANLADTPRGQTVVVDLGGRSPAPCDDGHRGLAPVSRYLPSPLGLHDLTGNAWEWVFDAHGPLEGLDVTDPVVVRPADRMRVVKGGSFRSPPTTARSGRAEARARSEAADDLGFRVVRTTE